MGHEIFGKFDKRVGFAVGNGKSPLNEISLPYAPPPLPPICVNECLTTRKKNSNPKLKSVTSLPCVTTPASRRVALAAFVCYLPANKQT